MCLLVALSRVVPGVPLVVAANRDELLARPSVTMTVLRPAAPELVGGRDAVAGGTWLATGDHGLLAGLTNKPASRDPSRRSRGDLPLLAASQPTAADAAAHLVEHVRAEERSPAWMLLGDRRSLWYVDLTGSGAPPVLALEPGVHVLENSPIDVVTPKSAAVRARVESMAQLRAEALIEALFALLGSHERREGSSPLEAPCVHAGLYGTRSSLVAWVPEGAAPRVYWTDGPPCTTKVEGPLPVG
jgi:uncharacterized protein with NRDE domain